MYFLEPQEQFGHFFLNRVCSLAHSLISRPLSRVRVWSSHEFNQTQRVSHYAKDHRTNHRLLPYCLWHCLFTDQCYRSNDYGGPPSSDDNVASIEGAELTLTYNDRNFSDGTEVQFFFTPDSAADLGGDFANLAYDPAITNGIDASQFATAPVSLGTFAFDAGLEGGTGVSYDLDLSAAGANMLAAVQVGADFQKIIASTAADADITFSGVGNTFDPGDPSLTLSVTNIPEPSAFALLGLSLLCLLAIRLNVNELTTH